MPTRTAIFVLGLAMMLLAPLSRAAEQILSNDGNTRGLDQVPLKDSRPDASVPCDLVDKYTTEWFLANTKPAHASPLQATALFYSAGMSAAARRRARRDGLVTIWDVWPCALYRHQDEASNPMRCIHASDAQRQAFFGNMSRAFATKAREGAAVLHAALHYNRPPTDGIWALVEYPVLVARGGAVHWIIKMKEGWVGALEGWARGEAGAGTGFEVFWERFPGAARLSEVLDPARWKLGTGVGRRAVEDDGESEACMTEGEMKFLDDNVRW